MSASKTMYEPLSIGVSVVGGLVAGKVFNQIWKQISDLDEAPDAKDLTQSTKEVMIAAAIQGLVLGLVRASINRAAAHGYRAVTHENLDSKPEHSGAA